MSDRLMSFETDRRQALKLAAGAAALPFALEGSAHAVAPSDAPIGLGRAQPFDLGWRFRKGEGEDQGTGVDDGAWRKVDLPHDWSIEDLPDPSPPKRVGPFDSKAIGGTATGYTAGGEGWYRKHFRLAPLPADARVEILFDGVSVISDVWLNGHALGSHVHGYTPFGFDLTPFLVRDGDNVLAVRVRNLGKNSRWYAGSGLYRQVTIDVLPTRARIARWGVGGWTRRVVGRQADIDITTRIEDAEPGLTLVTRLRSAQGRIVAEASAAAGREVAQSLQVKAANLWSPDTPHLYTIETELRRGKTVIDRTVQPFGVRIVTMDAAGGLRINGTQVRLRGGCIHHDNGLLGAAAFADADDRRVRLLKARGYNAIRSSHNPASSSLRGACDRLGMLLIDEAFDMWHSPKLKDDYSNHIAADWKNALAAMVLSARNSPSVIMWSIGNEIPYRSTPEGVEWCWKLGNEVRRLDPTRPVTAAINGVLGPLLVPSVQTARVGRAGQPDEASTVFLDVAGYNYRLEDIEADHKAHPERVIYASETFPRDAYDYQALVERAPYMLGEFVWTAMDYIGEAGIGASKRIANKGMPFYIAQYPWVNAWCGDIDLIGGQKPPSFARDVIWGLSPIEMMVQRPIPEGQVEFVAQWGWSDELPSWTWPNAVGQPMAVRLYTSGDRVALFVNGKPAGEKTLSTADKMLIELKVPYAPGTIEAIAYKGGREIGRKRIETVSAPARLRIASETAAMRSDRQGLGYVGIDIVDAAGRIIPEGEQAIRLTVDGPAELVGFGSANPMAVGSFQALEARSFRGRALAILRATGRKGVVRVEARSEGLQSARTTLKLI
jgi:beta-galactosidase